jgi:hypothetical protein
MEKEYGTFLNVAGNELPQGQEIELEIKDLTPGRYKYESRYVKAVVSPFENELPGADVLWIRATTGILNPQPWAIKIVKELGPYKSKAGRTKT